MNILVPVKYNQSFCKYEHNGKYFGFIVIGNDAIDSGEIEKRYLNSVDKVLLENHRGKFTNVNEFEILFYSDMSSDYYSEIIEGNKISFDVLKRGSEVGRLEYMMIRFINWDSDLCFPKAKSLDFKII